MVVILPTNLIESIFQAFLQNCNGEDFGDDSEIEPTDPLDMGIIRCNSEATRMYATRDKIFRN